MLDIAAFERNAFPALSLLKAMANDRRLMILCHLLHSELSVSDLIERIGLSQSALSQHLALLRRDHLVKTRKVAQTVYYSLDSGQAAQVLELLYQLYCPEDELVDAE